MELSRKQYPTSFVLSLEMKHLKSDPYPILPWKFSSGVITLSHMAEASKVPEEGASLILLTSLIYSYREMG